MHLGACFRLWSWMLRICAAIETVHEIGREGAVMVSFHGTGGCVV